MSYKGILISFEGMEGAGKTTQCEILQKKVEEKGYKAVLIREPGGVPISEEIRDVVLNPRNKGIAVTTEVLLFQAARAQLYAEVVIPSLKKGEVVIMDRTRDSSVVYQGIVRNIGVEWIEQLNDYSTQQTLPTVTFLLNLPAEVGYGRRERAQNLDRIEQEGVELQRKVVDAYLEVAHKDSLGRWMIIDGALPEQEVALQIWERVNKILQDKLPL